jgi:protein-disulfide isomerase
MTVHPRPWPFAAVILLFAIAGCGAIASSPFDSDTETRHVVPIDGSPVRGPIAAWVTIVEFSDFQCPYCRMAQAVLSDIDQTYPGKTRIVFKQYPLSQHRWAEPAADLSIEARTEHGDDGFWRTHDALWPLQPTLSGTSLEKLGADLGLDAALVHDAVYARRNAAAIQRDVDLGNAVGVPATPCFFINGRRLVGALPLSDFTPVIDEEIATAARLIAAGVDPASIYDEILQVARPAP